MLLFGLTLLMNMTQPTIYFSNAAASQVTISVNSNSVLLTADTSMGFTLHSSINEINSLMNSQTIQNYVVDADFKVVRLFDRYLGPNGYNIGGPCLSWNEATKTGTFDWTAADRIVKKIISLGAEPMICLSAWSEYRVTVPKGMAINSATLLPNPDSYAAFAAAWVQHFKSIGVKVKYYEIFNEIQEYIGWNPTSANQNRIANFVRLFNAAYTKMHQADSQVMISTDCSLEKHFFSYFIDNGVGLDYFDFHKYDAWKYPQFTDAEMFTKAETVYFTTDYNVYSVADARQIWKNRFGVTLPVVLSETNFNAAAIGNNNDAGSDPRIPQLAGAVRTALLARACILNGVEFIAYHCLTTSKSYEITFPTGGTGFGMINRDNSLPWYPYYMMRMIGSNFDPNDKIIQSSATDSTNFRTLAWINDGKINLLIINKSHNQYNVKVQGLQGTITYEKIDEAISWTNPKVQSGQLGEYLTINGYTVALFQSNSASPTPTPSTSPTPTPSTSPTPTPSTSPNTIFEDDFESRSFSKWTSTTTTSGEIAAINSYYPQSGAYHSRFFSNGASSVENAYCSKDISASEIYIRGYFRIVYGLNQIGTDARFYFLRLTAGGSTIATAGLRASNSGLVWNSLVRDGQSWVDVSSDVASIQMNRWYCVELHWKKDATQGLMELYIDGQLVAKTSNINTSYFGNADIVNFGLVSDTNTRTNLIIYGDTFKASNSYVGIA